MQAPMNSDDYTCSNQNCSVFNAGVFRTDRRIWSTFSRLRTSIFGIYVNVVNKIYEYRVQNDTECKARWEMVERISWKLSRRSIRHACNAVSTVLLLLRNDLISTVARSSLVSRFANESLNSTRKSPTTISIVLWSRTPRAVSQR